MGFPLSLALPLRPSQNVRPTDPVPLTPSCLRRRVGFATPTPTRLYVWETGRLPSLPVPTGKPEFPSLRPSGRSGYTGTIPHLRPPHSLVSEDGGPGPDGLVPG